MNIFIVNSYLPARIISESLIGFRPDPFVTIYEYCTIVIEINYA